MLIASPGALLISMPIASPGTLLTNHLQLRIDGNPDTSAGDRYARTESVLILVSHTVIGLPDASTIVNRVVAGLPNTGAVKSETKTVTRAIMRPLLIVTPGSTDMLSMSALSRNGPAAVALLDFRVGLLHPSFLSLLLSDFPMGPRRYLDTVTVRTYDYRRDRMSL